MLFRSERMPIERARSVDALIERLLSKRPSVQPSFHEVAEQGFYIVEKMPIAA